MKKLIALMGAIAVVGAAPLAEAGSLQKSGSISVKDMNESQYLNAAKIDMKAAIDAALERQKGKVKSAELDDEEGFLIYEVTVVTPEGEKFDVFVDAGNKSILGVQKDSDIIG